MEIRAGQPDALLRLQVTGDLRGEWDADRLEQVVSNLVANAIQHGNGTPITLTAQEHGTSVTSPSTMEAHLFPQRCCHTSSNRSLADAQKGRCTALGLACSSRERSCRRTADTFR